jgi:DNA-directed RNA polymerase subunit beta
VFFDDEIHPNGKKLFSARIIPYRGSWVEFTLDVNDIMYVHIDSRRKLAATTLLRALGFSTNSDLLKEFYNTAVETVTPKKGNKFIGTIAAENVVDPSTGEVILTAGSEIGDNDFKKLCELKIGKLQILDVDFSNDAGVIRNSLSKDTTASSEEALFKIYALIRPGDAPTVELAKDLFEKLFFNPKRYDLGEVGRYMINQRLELDVPLEQCTLSKEDFLAIVKYLIDLRNGKGDIDDIDHLGNRRARSVGELLSNQFSVGHG